MEERSRSRLFNAIWAVINLLLVVCLVVVVINAFSSAESTSFEQNVQNIRTLTSASADKVAIVIQQYIQETEKLALFLNAGMTMEEASSFIHQGYENADGFCSWLLIDPELQSAGLAVQYFQGYPFGDTSAPMGFRTSSYRELASMAASTNETTMGQVRFLREFTDPVSLQKVFGLVSTVSLMEDGEVRYMMLLHLIRSAEVNDILVDNQAARGLNYFDYSCVIVDPSGDYVISTPYFQGTNFLDYIELYNGDFSADRQQDIISNLALDHGGDSFYFNNNREEKTVFTIMSINNVDWFILSAVPIESFNISYDFKTNFLGFALCFFLLFCVDFLWLLNMNKKLRKHMEAEKLANSAKGSFMSRMSHEIRTPLNAIIGYNTLATADLSKARTKEEMASSIMTVSDYLAKSDMASKHLLSIINDVLDMSAVESGKIVIANERFDLKGMIESLTATFFSQASSKGVKFNVAIDQLDHEWFMGDQLRVTQIITNLMSNAVKFTPEGGSVKLSISQNEEGSMVFEIADTGIGMTQEYIEHIWTPFEQADSSIRRRFGGSGLGLAISKNFIDLMGGTISIHSAVGKGTTFRVELPLKPAGASKSNDSIDFSRVRALFVDDDPGTCDYVRLLFNRFGCQCTTVCSGKEAVEAVKTAKTDGTDFSICILDWKMPGMDGLETATEIRKLTGDTLPIIVLSAYDFSEISDQTRECGITRCISKPLFPSTLFDLLASTVVPEERKPMEKPEEIRFKGSKVLLVEDNQMNMEIARRLLTSAGLSVDIAWNGKEAVDIFNASPYGFFKVILMDIQMPVMDGYQATREIRSGSHPQARTIPIIAMTADAFAQNVAEAMEAGMNEHIAKPIDIKILMATLKKFIPKG